MEEIGKIKNKIIYRDIIRVRNGSSKDLPIDSLIKIAVLAVIAGYEKSNDILFRGEKFPRTGRSLENFLSFILNDRNFAPKKFKAKISNYLSSRDSKSGGRKSGRMGHKYNSIMLFSGGFDSSSALFYALDRGWNPLLLWVGFGQKNEREEEKVVRKLAKKFGRKLVTIQLNLKNYVERGWKDWSYIVPGRNFMFAVLGAAILAQSKKRTNYIIMGVTEEEYGHSDPCVDKSPRFFKYSSRLFSEFYKKNIHLISPLKSISKTELVANWKNRWFEKYAIDPHETVSCYFGTNCGVCNSCFKRSISFISGGIGLDKNLKRKPFLGNESFVRSYIKRCFDKVGPKTKFSKKRAVETLVAYKKSFDHLPEDVKKIINNLPPKLEKELIREEKRLNKFVWK